MNTSIIALLCALAGVAIAAPSPQIIPLRLPNFNKPTPILPQPNFNKPIPTLPPRNFNKPIPILAYKFDGPYPDGLYNYNYATGNGIQAQEEGKLVKIARDKEALRVRGSFSYTDPNGNPIAVSYIADENGFQPKGDHLHPVPAGILKALKYNAEHPEEDNL